MRGWEPVHNATVTMPNPVRNFAGENKDCWHQLLPGAAANDPIPGIAIHSHIQHTTRPAGNPKCNTKKPGALDQQKSTSLRENKDWYQLPSTAELAVHCASVVSCRHNLAGQAPLANQVCSQRCAYTHSHTRECRGDALGPIHAQLPTSMTVGGPTCTHQ